MKLSNIVRIAKRNLLRQRKRSILLGGAIAFGIFIISLISGLTESFITNTTKNFADFMAGHLFIIREERLAPQQADESAQTAEVIRDDTKLLDIINEINPYVKSIAKRSVLFAHLMFGQNRIFTKLEGINWENEVDFRNSLILAEGSWEEITTTENALIISEQNAERLNVRINDYILCRTETATGQINVIEFILKGIIIDTGLLGSLSTYASLKSVNQALNIGSDTYTSLSIYLKKYEYIDLVTEKLYKIFEKEDLTLSPLTFRSGFIPVKPEEEWGNERFLLLNINEFIGQIKGIIGGIKNSGYFIFVIMILLIMIGITSTYWMILYERLKEIGTMRSLGMQKSNITSLFFTEVIILSVLSSFTGLVVSFLCLWLISLIDFGLENPLSILMRNGYISVEINIWLTFLSVLLILIAIILAVSFPTRKAVSLKPVNALRKRL